MNENEKEVSPFQNTCETSESIKKQYCEINQLYSFNIHCVRLKKKTTGYPQEYKKNLNGTQQMECCIVTNKQIK